MESVIEPEKIKSWPEQTQPAEAANMQSQKKGVTGAWKKGENRKGSAAASAAPTKHVSRVWPKF